MVETIMEMKRLSVTSWMMLITTTITAKLPTAIISSIVEEKVAEEIPMNSPIIRVNTARSI